MGSEVVDVETVASTMKVVLFWAVGILIPIIGLQAEEVIDDMVILEAPTRFTRESEVEDETMKIEDEDAGSSREGKQFFWGLGPMFPNGFIMQRGSGWWGVPFYGTSSTHATNEYLLYLQGLRRHLQNSQSMLHLDLQFAKELAKLGSGYQRSMHYALRSS